MVITPASPAALPREQASVPEILAAVDLGSNSFHLAVARVVGRGLTTIDSVQERVQLAAGLGDDRVLDEAAQERGLAALERFGQRLRHASSAVVRAVGTDTLRIAVNAQSFLERAAQVLGHPIEVLSGEEEARLIYRGVAQSMPTEAEPVRQLVIDIGGGSTECILGAGLEPEHVASLHIGCVGFTRQFFADGVLSRERFRRAQIAAQLAFERLPEPFFRGDFTRALGSSGTFVALDEIVRQNQWSLPARQPNTVPNARPTLSGPLGGGITKDSLTRLREAILQAGHVERLQIPGLKPQRAGVIAAGLAIARAAFKALPIRHLQSTSAALREGVLYDLLGRFMDGDIRESTIDHLVDRFHVDRLQASRVEATALILLERSRWCAGPELVQARRYLAWAARLHELGLAISFHGYHKHGAYILANTALPGFSRDDQSLIATLVLGHRKKLAREIFVAVPRHLRELGLRLTVLLRLAVRLNRSRSEKPLEAQELGLDLSGRVLTLSLPTTFLAEHPLTQADLDEEAERLAAAGFVLLVR
ncbi:MAG: Ppx/GppA family phosphatase [Deltaproteobacteria bacterium]|nr:Ppx/GppA family phosphatase [Deltaproteobacteria bacterium]